MPVSTLAFCQTLAAGQSYGNLAREKGDRRKLGPPGTRAGMAPMEGVQETASEWQKEDESTVPVSMDRAMDTPRGCLKPMEDDSERRQAMIAGAVKMREVSESYAARNSKSREPNEDEQ
eukprot:5181964-Pyramimonas_sp.AAC.1